MSKLGLSALREGQVGAEFLVNRNFVLVDALLQLVVKSATIAEIPTDLAVGSAYLVPAGATGTWQSHVGSLAVFTEAGWDYVKPCEGWSIWVLDTKNWIRCDAEGLIELPSLADLKARIDSFEARVLMLESR